MTTEFIKAAASYFGMDPDRLSDLSSMHVGSSGKLQFMFRVEIDADDYLGISDRMRSIREPMSELGNYVTNTLKKGGWFDFEKSLTSGQPAEGEEDQPGFDPVPRVPERRKVVHLYDDVSGMIAKAEYVWVSRAHTTDQQRATALAQDKGSYAIRVEDLTDMQRAAAGLDQSANRIQAAVEEAKLPETVWMSALDLEQHQMQMASDVRDLGSSRQYLVQVAVLTPAQRAKAGVQ